MADAPPPLASLDELTARLGDQDIDDVQAAAFLDDASALVRLEAGQTWLTDADVLEEVPRAVVMVVLNVARRAYLNPEGSIQPTAGPFSDRFDEARAQVFYLTDTERLVLQRFRTTSSGLWAMRTSRGDQLETTSTTEYADETSGGDPIALNARGPL